MSSKSRFWRPPGASYEGGLGPKLSSKSSPFGAAMKGLGSQLGSKRRFLRLGSKLSKRRLWRPPLGSCEGGFGVQRVFKLCRGLPSVQIFEVVSWGRVRNLQQGTIQILYPLPSAIRLPRFSGLHEDSKNVEAKWRWATDTESRLYPDTNFSPDPLGRPLKHERMGKPKQGFALRSHCLR